MRILVTGAKGMLASALLPIVSEGHEVFRVDIQDFDITQEAAVTRYFREVRPEFVFHLAAFTDVDACEDVPRRAMEVNVRGTQNVARGSAEVGAVMLYLSSDYVFDGSLGRPYREGDVPNPRSAYGLSKHGGEQQVQALVPRHFIVRSSWLYGPNGKNFVATIVKAARTRDELRVVDDQRGSPTYTRHLAAGLSRMLDVRDYGVYHMSGAGNCTWFEFTEAILQQAGLTQVRVVPISTRELARKAPRPAFSVLENRRMAENQLALLPHWRDGLTQYLTET